jgi:hypothetical protein
MEPFSIVHWIIIVLMISQLKRDEFSLNRFGIPKSVGF